MTKMTQTEIPLRVRCKIFCHIMTLDYRGHERNTKDSDHGHHQDRGKNPLNVWLHDRIMFLIFKQMHLGVPAKQGEFHQSGGEEKGENSSTTSHPQSSVCHDLCNEIER